VSAGVEEDAHMTLMRSKSSSVIGRDSELSTLSEFVTSSTVTVSDELQTTDENTQLQQGRSAFTAAVMKFT